ncbi:hypothetical protein Tco_0647946 [Tanacetum coccineum]
MSTANQQTLAELGASDRPLILEKRSYVAWDSIFKGPYKRKYIPDPNNESETIPKPISKMSKIDKEQYFADIKVMNYILQGIPNDIYNYVDACPYAKQMWARMKRLMQGSDIRNGNMDAGRQNKNQATNARNGLL